MTTIKTPEEAIEDEKEWLQSGIDALKDVEQNGYACTAEELSEKIAKLKKTDWVKSSGVILFAKKP